MKPIARAMTRRSGVAVAVVTASLLVLGAGSAGAAAVPPVPASAPTPALATVPQGVGSAALQGARAVGQTAAGARETVSFVLAPRNLGLLVRTVNAGMPGGRITAAQFARRFGQTPAHITALTRFLARHHITSHVHTDRLDVTTTGRVADYNGALAIRQQNFALAAVPATAGRAGRPAMTIHAATQAVRLPRALAAYVTAVLGLTSYPAAADEAVRAPAAVRGPAAVHAPASAAGSRAAAPQGSTALSGNLTPASFVNRYHLRAGEPGIPGPGPDHRHHRAGQHEPG